MNDAALRPAEAPPPSRWVEVLVLALCAAGPLLPTLGAAFVYDDTTIIRDNVVLRGWGALASVWGEPYWPSDGVDALGLYRPLHLAMLSTIWNAGGGRAIWFHVYALTLAVLTTLAVWWMLRRGIGWLAAFTAAAWFAAHPLHVEAAASVANTSELLVVLCTVGLVKVLGDSETGPNQDARDGMRIAAMGGLAAAALLAKESGLLAVPLAAVTVWGWRRNASNAGATKAFLRANARAWAAAFVCVVAVLLARLVVLGAPISHASIAAQGLSQLSGAERVGAMLSLWPRIAGMLAWPTALSPYYGPTTFPTHRALLAVVAAVSALAVIGVAVVLAKRGDRRPLVAVAWVCLTYFPASNLLAATGQIVSDRTLFGATVGAALGIAWVLSRLSISVRRVAAIALALLVARSVVVSARYATDWTTHRTLWARLAAVQPREHLGFKLLGMDARARGDTSDALKLLGTAFAMAPEDRQIRFEYGQVLYTTGRYPAAAATLAPLIRDGDARSEREFVALYLDAVGRAGGAEAVIRAATPLLHSETAPVAALFLGVAQEQLGHRAAAESAYAAGLKRSSGDSALVARWLGLRGSHAHE